MMGEEQLRNAGSINTAAIALFAVGFPLRLLTRFSLGCYLLEISSDLHNVLISRMLNSRGTVREKYTVDSLTNMLGTVLKKSEELLVLQYTDFLEDTLELLLSMIYMAIISRGLMLPSVLLFTLALYITMKRIYKATLVISRVKSRISKMFQSLNYQLINIIPTFRHLGLIDTLTTKFTHLCDNRFLSDNRTAFDLNMWISTVGHAISAFFLVSTFAYGILLILNMSLNSCSDVWSVVYCIVLSLRIARLFTNLLTRFTDMISERLETQKIDTFLSRHKEETLETFDETLPNYTEPTVKYGILMKNVYLTMGNILALKKINLGVKLDAKMALIGAKGVGKSHIINLLVGQFQKDTLSSDEFSTIRLLGKPLKPNMGVIPFVDVMECDPALFEGKVRHNIDPFHKFTDEELVEKLGRIVRLFGAEELLADTMDEYREHNLLLNSPYRDKTKELLPMSSLLERLWTKKADLDAREMSENGEKNNLSVDKGRRKEFQDAEAKDSPTWTVSQRMIRNANKQHPSELREESAENDRRKRSTSLCVDPIRRTLRRSEDKDEKPKKLSRKYILQTESQFKEYLKEKTKKDHGNVEALESIILKPNLERFEKPVWNE